MEYYNSKGMSLAYAIIAVVVLGIIAATLLSISHSHRIQEIQYTNSLSARAAVHAGLNDARSFFESRDMEDSVVALLNRWVDGDADAVRDRWVLDRDVGDSLWIVSGNMEYRVEVVGFDPNTYSISIFSEGVGRGGARASALGVYTLHGLERRVENVTVPINALQIDNGNYEFNVQLTINGPTSVRRVMRMNNGPVRFNGPFRFDADHDGELETSSIGVTTRFDGSAYFAGPLHYDGGEYRFMDNVGFAQDFRYGSSGFTMEGGNIFFNGAVDKDGGGTDDLGGADLHYSESASVTTANGEVTPLENQFTNKGNVHTDYGDDIDTLPNHVGVHEKLGLVHFNYNLPLQHGDIWRPTGPITAEELNTEFAQRELWEDEFLVVHFDNISSGGMLIQSHGVEFDGKAIIIINGAAWQGIRLNTTSTANVAIYAEDYDGSSYAFHEPEYMRGFIYFNSVSDDNQQTFRARHPLSHYDGAIYAGKDAGTKFDGGWNAHQMVTFNPDVINELAAVGLFSDPDDYEENVIVVSPNGISSSLLSRSF
ncbi:hypothetical protein [Chitinivibrio alkaliphilus]|uniref:Type 4 fimbrial biogenesis protein PilX N-terminal domain-containing protein n=1 Tax=Chitinivibrio alkaliphilus ACht1 TaxID=1313304 RepID=U7DAM5_9BACT|nr:hypothetical protein [Chitinivibrio alkaliphilus]ERP39082.1 hypothetical protein CALK_0247 [Chitinivibrio alkaliphilus ACht1]